MQSRRREQQQIINRQANRIQTLRSITHCGINKSEERLPSVRQMVTSIKPWTSGEMTATEESSVISLADHQPIVEGEGRGLKNSDCTN